MKAIYAGGFKSLINSFKERKPEVNKDFSQKVIVRLHGYQGMSERCGVISSKIK